MDEPRPSIERLGDAALLVRFGNAPDAALNERVHEWCARVAEGRPSWIQDIVPAYASLALFIDIDDADLGDDPLSVVERWVASTFAEPAGARVIRTARTVDVPVRYGGEDGPDLDAAAAELGLSQDEIVARHIAGRYRVAMIGFSPGFPYLLGLDPSIALPRLTTPRLRVPAGSVGIGGAQTGIYPRESPGGWRILGRTPLSLFDPDKNPPALLVPGDAVRFVAL